MSAGTRQWLALLLPVTALALARPADADPFQRLEAGVRGDDVAAVAFDRAGARLAAGDADGVLLGRPGESLRRVLRRGPVHALAFLPASVDAARPLLAATERGLHRIDAAGLSAPVDVGPGEAVRRGVDLATEEGVVALATGAGVFVSADARRWSRLAGALPSGPVTALALRGPECWLVVGGELWRAVLRSRPSGFVAADAERLRVPFSSSPLDLRLDLPGLDALVIYPDALALRRKAGSGWEVLRPGLPPGASALRLTAALGRLWIASDRGLLLADEIGGPWRRAAPPAGSAAVRDLVGDAEVLYAATDRGLLAAVSSPAPAPAAPRRTPEPAPGPSIQQVHLAALSYLRLQPSRFDALRRGLGRRGWLPELDLDVGAQRDSGRGVDFDQSFVSGETRFLTDRDRDRTRQMDVGLRLSWDLGDTAYNPDAIDVSREARAVIELRDEVLDEITQLYFERQRVLADLARLEDRGGSEAQRLRLRARELAAGIDAWTGGWFSRHAPPVPP